MSDPIVAGPHRIVWTPAQLTEDTPEMPAGFLVQGFAAVAEDRYTLRALVITATNGVKSIWLGVRSPILAPDDHAPLTGRPLTLAEIWSAARQLMPKSMMAVPLAVNPAKWVDVTLIEYQRLPG